MICKTPLKVTNVQKEEGEEEGGSYIMYRTVLMLEAETLGSRAGLAGQGKKEGSWKEGAKQLW